MLGPVEYGLLPPPLVLVPVAVIVRLCPDTGPPLLLDPPLEPLEPQAAAAMTAVAVATTLIA
jgi:hypothetical protein